VVLGVEVGTELVSGVVICTARGFGAAGAGVVSRLIACCCKVGALLAFGFFLDSISANFFFAPRLIFDKRSMPQLFFCREFQAGEIVFAGDTSIPLRKFRPTGHA